MYLSHFIYINENISLCRLFMVLHKMFHLPFCMKSEEGNGDSLEGEERILHNNKGKSYGKRRLHGAEYFLRS